MAKELIINFLAAFVTQYDSIGSIQFIEVIDNVKIVYNLDIDALQKVTALSVTENVTENHSTRRGMTYYLSDPNKHTRAEGYPPFKDLSCKWDTTPSAAAYLFPEQPDNSIIPTPTSTFSANTSSDDEDSSSSSSSSDDNQYINPIESGDERIANLNDRQIRAEIENAVCLRVLELQYMDDYGLEIPNFTDSESDT
jgi:hypothetical protein